MSDRDLEQLPTRLRRHAGPAWKALRFYFGLTAACLVAFTVVYHGFDLLDGSSARNVGTERMRADHLSEEREARLMAFEEAKAQLEMHRKSRAPGSPDVSLLAPPLEEEEAAWVGSVSNRAEAQEASSVAAPSPWAAAPVAPLERRVGAGRVAGRDGINLDAFATQSPLRSDFAEDEEPETVPAGDETQRVELPEYTVAETYDVGYTATATLAGSRMHVTGDDPDAVLALSPFEVSSSGRASARSQSSYQPSGEPSATSDGAKSADSAWAEGFGGSASIAVPAAGAIAIATPQYLRDIGATDDGALLHYAANTEVSGVQGNFSGAGSAAPVNGRHLMDAPKEDGSVRPAPVAATAAPPRPGRPAGGEGAPRVRGTTARTSPDAIDETSTAREPVSTFSLHVGDASFKLAQAALARGELPEPTMIRPEEFYNAFDYGDPAPSLGEKVACRIEQAAHPFLQQRTLVRIAMKVAAVGRGPGQPLRLTVLLDTSGSMEREDRVASVRRALDVLATLLSAEDRVTLVGFARQPRLLAEGVRGDEAGRLADMAARTPAEGGTNIEAALELAAELALRQYDRAAQNRIVLLTDGAANLGNADPAQLAGRIERLRGRGIAFDACGVGTNGLDDAILEALTRKGDGRYTVIDSPAAADAEFAQQLAGAFRPAARNVKVQVRFNPARVGAYRLLGFEKHRLREEDFRNDQVDAAELAAEEAAVALYQIEELAGGEGEIGDVFVRFQDTTSGRMVERSWTIAHDARLRPFDRASPGMQLVGSASLVAEILRGGAIGDQVDLGALVPVMNGIRSRYAAQPRVQEFATMFDQLRRKLGR